ncbi:NACHT domain-containing protein [Streptomyces sp. 5-6(2022)]|uniref:NACHT domain-containing protein n=1 Tax=Streptomyces sp. 5-6(2022) TaxID=2936510 RepID=UPI0023B9A4DF|nr:NACHT domain-containing protein [Streptomyces sp. 5-6(2022)]
MRRRPGEARGSGPARGGRNEISGGTFHGPVIQAQSVGSVIAQVRPVGRDYLFAAFAGAVLVALGVFLGAGGSSLVSGVRARWLAAAGCVSLAVLLGAGLVSRHRREVRRLLIQVPHSSLHDTAEALARTLAVRYAQEEARSRTDDPMPLTVRWAPAAPGLGDHHESLADDGEVPILEGEFSHIVDQYARLPRGRLLVLGAPGAGKSVLVLRLARDLLRRRRVTEPVPVVLPLGSWNPRVQPSLWWWAAGALAEDHPDVLTSPVAPSRAVAHQLITSGLVLPVLDGFDELPARVRVTALRQLRDSLRGTGPLILTSRSAAFTTAVEEGDVRLAGMAAVELRPLDVADVRAYLPRSARPRTAKGPREASTGTKWDPVLAPLADERDDAHEVRLLRAVLRTPLMVSLARAAYSDTTADPAELLTPGRFHTAHDLERHLFSAFVDAAYAPDSTAAPGAGPTWTGAEAHRWLGELALRQTETEQPDIAWWHVDRMVPLRARMLLTLPLPALLAVAVSLTGLPWAESASAMPLPMWLVVLIGGTGAVVADWYQTADDEFPQPQRLRRPTPRDVRSALRNTRWRISLGLGAVLLGVLWVLAATTGGNTIRTAAVTCTGGLLLLGLITLRNAVRAPADPETHGPEALLRADRRAALWFAVVSLPGSPAPLRMHKGLLACVSIAVPLWGLRQGQDLVDTARWATAAVALAIGIGVWSCAVSAWGRYCAARFWLGLGGHLPWRLTRFLRDAHRRGVLRQSGGSYRFRHLGLQHALAADAATRRAQQSGSEEFSLDEESERLLTRRVELEDKALAMAGGLVASLAAFALITGALGGPPAAGPIRSLDRACTLLTPHDLRPVVADPARVTGYDKDRGVWRAPKLIDSGYPKLHSASSCVYAEQAPFRPDAMVTVGVGFTAAEPGRNSSASAERWVRSFPMLEPARRDGVGDSAVASNAFLPATDPAARQLSGTASIPIGVIRARVDNAVVIVDVSMEFATTARTREMAEAIARTVLRNAGLTGPARPGERLPRDLPRPELPKRSRFGLYHDEPAKRLHGARWRGDERSEILGIQLHSTFWMAVRLPRPVRCAHTPHGEEHEDGLSCTFRTPDGPLRMELVVYACPSACTGGDRDTFYSRRPGPSPGTLPRHDAYTRYRLVDTDEGRTGYLVRSLRTWWRLPGQKDRTPRDYFLWLRVTAPGGHGGTAEKIMNDVFQQQPASGG